LRILGLAFASADLLFEIDERGVITFAVGATSKVTGVGKVTLPKSSWRVLIEPSDQGRFQAMIDSLEATGRKGPVRCRLRDVPGLPPRYADLSACRLPQLAPNISCALALAPDALKNAASDTLMDRAGFEAAVSDLLLRAKDSGVDVELALVEVAGLAKAKMELSTEAAGALVEAIRDMMSQGAVAGAASQVEAERFALVRRRSTAAGDPLLGQVKAAGEAAGVVLDPTAAALPLGAGPDPGTLRALRVTLDHFIKEGAGAPGDLKAVFGAALNATLKSARAFTELVDARDFKIAYQPVVDLTTRAVHHYEALVRFPDGGSPADTIRMAEDLDLIEELDLAVAEAVIATLKTEPAEVRIAVNVSGRSVLRPKFMDRLKRLTFGEKRLKDRLLFEITESATLANLELAETRIQSLRRDGFKVCIDDFGAGAASLAYLRNLTVDIVKIDGQYVRNLKDEGRDGAMIRHLTALCRDIGVKTIAEMVETEAALTLLKDMGVDMGQGYIFGKPVTDLPILRAPDPAVPLMKVARRRGVVDGWG
jgi:EAL domain-containing protein (putative c-di-GMP-specific phosphodiesterase class I)